MTYSVSTAVILAAGRGTRLEPLTLDRPKPMIDVGKRPLLAYIVDCIRAAGIRRLVIVTGYLGHKIEEYFGDGQSLGIDIEYVLQDTIDGTGGALRRARQQLGGEPFLLNFGDILISKPNYQRIARDYQQSSGASMMAVNPVDDPCRGAAVYWEESSRTITRIVEKPAKGQSTTRWNQAGLFVFTPIIHSYIERLPLSPRGEYELTEAIHSMLSDGHPVRALPIEGLWSEIGTPDDLERITHQLQQNPGILETTDPSNPLGGEAS